MAGVSIKNLTRRSLRSERRVFSAIVKEVLPGWDISLVFVDAKKARTLNEKLRGKKYVPNVLSYIVGEKGAEIIICPSEAKKQAPDYNLQPTTYNLYLFIHGVLHIKGWAHGATMERCERNLLAKFVAGNARKKQNETTHRHRHRYRHVPGKNGRRRGALR